MDHQEDEDNGDLAQNDLKDKFERCQEKQNKLKGRHIEMITLSKEYEASLMELLDKIEENLQKKTRLESCVKKKEEIDTAVMNKDDNDLDMEVEIPMETSNQDLKQ